MMPLTQDKSRNRPGIDPAAVGLPNWVNAKPT
jgi:hypothetical protein